MNRELHIAGAVDSDDAYVERFRHDVITGLTNTPKKLDAKYFYDKVGDALFQQIMSLSEYYLTRCELDIFRNRTADIAALILRDGEPFDLIELGAGDALKSSYLLKYLLGQQVEFTYMPIDISGNILKILEDRLMANLPGLDRLLLEGEYFDMLEKAAKLSSRRKVVLFLGSNIGNMEPAEAEHFCAELRSRLRYGDMVLMGFDLKKNPQIILNAYNDSKGITAAFNLNYLSRINKELGADFVLDKFQHYQSYDPISGACRSFLISLADQVVTIGENKIMFLENEYIHMEISQKFSNRDIAALADKSKFQTFATLKDTKGWFVDVLWQVG